MLVRVDNDVALAGADRTPTGAMPDAAPARVRAALEASGGTGAAPALVALTHDNSCVGVVSRLPDSADILVGAGPFGPLAALRDSYAVASDAFRVASLLRRGVQGPAQLGWRLAAARRPELTDMYARQFLDPLRGEAPFSSDILAAVTTYIASDLNAGQAAQVLGVHVNTVRYRMRRFEELTGANLRSVDDLVGVRWALEFSEGAPWEGAATDHA